TLVYVVMHTRSNSEPNVIHGSLSIDQQGGTKGKQYLKVNQRDLLLDSSGKIFDVRDGRVRCVPIGALTLEEGERYLATPVSNYSIESLYSFCRRRWAPVVDWHYRQIRSADGSCRTSAPA